MQRLLIPSMVVVGLVLIVLGTQWNRIRPATSYWSKEQAAEFNNAQGALHGLVHRAKGGGDETKTPEFIAARGRFAKISDELESARNSRSRSGNILIGFGLVAIISALILHYRGASQP